MACVDVSCPVSALALQVLKEICNEANRFNPIRVEIVMNLRSSPGWSSGPGRIASHEIKNP